MEIIKGKFKILIHILYIYARKTKRYNTHNHKKGTKYVSKIRILDIAARCLWHYRLCARKYYDD